MCYNLFSRGHLCIARRLVIVVGAGGDKEDPKESVNQM